MSFTADHPFEVIIPETEDPQVRQRRLDPRHIIAIVGAVAMGASVALAAPRVLDAYTASREAAPVRAEEASAPAVELPREWRWEKKAVNFDHMYRSR